MAEAKHAIKVLQALFLAVPHHQREHVATALAALREIEHATYAELRGKQCPACGSTDTSDDSNPPIGQCLTCEHQWMVEGDNPNETPAVLFPR